MGFSVRAQGPRRRGGILAVALLLSTAAPALAWAQTSGTSSPDEMAQMRAELKALQAEEAAARQAEAARSQRINALARQLGVAETAAPPIETLPEKAEAAAPVQTTGQAERTFKIYGFAQADYIQDFNRVDPSWDATLRPSKIPTTPGQFGTPGQAIISVRQSRFGVQASDEIAGHPLFVKFEFDLYGTGVDAGQTTFRLRHAYGSWGPLLAGQTNSNWMDIDSFPNTIDYWGPNGMVFIRTPQIRLTYQNGPHEIAGALEYAGNDIDTGNLRLIGDIPGNEALHGITNDEKFPDLTMHYRYTGGWGHVQVAGIVRDVAYDTPGEPDNRPKGSQTGWGVNLTSNVKTWQNDVLHLAYVYGEGIASYMNDGGTDLGPTVVQAPNGPPTVIPDAVPLMGLVAYYDHYWNKHFSTSLGYSQTQVWNVNFQQDNAFRIGRYASINLLWTPDPKILIGAEYLWGQREDKNGAIGDDNRLQFTVKYSFSKEMNW
jgi:hypothetical protein